MSSNLNLSNRLRTLIEYVEMFGTSPNKVAAELSTSETLTVGLSVTEG